MKAERFGEGAVVIRSGETDLLTITNDEAESLYISIARMLHKARVIHPGVEHLGNVDIPVDVERWRALLRARAEATGFEHAIIDVQRDKPGHPRFTLCWPTGDEQALADLVVEVFAATLAAVQERDVTVKRALADLQALRELVPESVEGHLVEIADRLRAGATSEGEATT